MFINSNNQLPNSLSESTPENRYPQLHFNIIQVFHNNSFVATLKSFGIPNIRITNLINLITNLLLWTC